MSETQYLKIRLSSIHPAHPVPFDLYVLVNEKYIHYLRAGDLLRSVRLDKFEKMAPDQFFIKVESKPLFKSYVHELMNHPSLPPVEKALILRESSMALVEELFENPDVEQALKESREVVHSFIELMGVEPDAMAHLIGLSSHDFYTYNHSLDVSIYSLGLGQAAGYSEEDLAELGTGALFHDIGKRNVDVDIICKDGPLDDQEWAQMQKHPDYGLVILNDHEVSEAVKACCFEHHESFAGNGYPQQLEGDEIHPMARIVALTDTYDALTTKRSYNEPMTPSNALNFMNEKLKSKYDPDLLKAMYSVLFKMNAATKAG